MSTVTYSISQNFSRFPAGRYPADGKYNGQRFRDEVLIPLVEENSEVYLILDGTRGYGSSFLEEAFGGLVRHFGLESRDMIKKIHIIARNPRYQIEISDHMTKAVDKLNQDNIRNENGDT